MEAPSQGPAHRRGSRGRCLPCARSSGPTRCTGACSTRTTRRSGITSSCAPVARLLHIACEWAEQQTGPDAGPGTDGGGAGPRVAAPAGRAGRAAAPAPCPAAPMTDALPAAVNRESQTAPAPGRIVPCRPAGAPAGSGAARRPRRHPRLALPALVPGAGGRRPRLRDRDRLTRTFLPPCARHCQPRRDGCRGGPRWRRDRTAPAWPRAAGRRGSCGAASTWNMSRPGVPVMPGDGVAVTACVDWTDWQAGFWTTRPAAGEPASSARPALLVGERAAHRRRPEACGRRAGQSAGAVFDEVSRAVRRLRARGLARGVPGAAGLESHPRQDGRRRPAVPRRSPPVFAAAHPACCSWRVPGGRSRPERVVRPEPLPRAGRRCGRPARCRSRAGW